MSNLSEHAPLRETPGSRWDKISLTIQLALSFVIAGGVLLFLLFYGGKADDDEDKRPTPPEEVVKVAGPRTLFIKSGTPLDQKLDKEATVRLEPLTTPLLSVTGTVLVSLRPGDGEAQ